MESETAAYKTCKKCKCKLQLAKFYTTKQGKLGVDSICKVCSRLAKNARNALSNYDVSVSSKKCFHCGEIKDATLFGRSIKNKDGLYCYCRKCDSKLQLASARDYNRGFYNKSKQQAKAKGRPITFNEEDFIAWWASCADVCTYCGISLTEYPRMRDFVLTTQSSCARYATALANPAYKVCSNLSVDRKDSSLGYRLDNICKACVICNNIKGSILSYTQMLVLGHSIGKEIKEAMINK